MKGILKNRKLFVIIGVIVITLLLSIIIINVTKKEDKTIHKVETHSMYVKINPLVKLVFKEKYSLCKNKNGKEEICGGITNEVVGYELINDDAKSIYKDLDFINKDLFQSLLMLCETARDNKIVFDKLELTTDSKSISIKDITAYLKNNSKYEVDYSVYVNFKEHIDENNLLKDDDAEKYLITFDSDGGNTIESQTVNKGDKASVPTTPTKNGYKFVEWQLEGKSFDFNTEITGNITLKAKWEQSSTTNNNNNNNNNNNIGSNQSNVNSGSNQSSGTNNNTQQSEQPKEDIHKGIINLNDNVMYITGTIFYKCNNCISDSVIQKIKTFKGISHNGLDSSTALIYGINLYEGKYPDNIYGGGNLGIVEDMLLQCGAEPIGGATSEPQLLNEQICTQFKLSCDRW